jgi:hypothetical protein
MASGAIDPREPLLRWVLIAKPLTRHDAGFLGASCLGELAFGPQPVFEIIVRLCAPFHVELVGSQADLVVNRSVVPIAV